MVPIMSLSPGFNRQQRISARNRPRSALVRLRAGCSDSSAPSSSNISKRPAPDSIELNKTLPSLLLRRDFSKKYSFHDYAQARLAPVTIHRVLRLTIDNRFSILQRLRTGVARSLSSFTV